MYKNKLRVSELNGKENQAAMANRPLKSQDYQSQLKKLPFPVEEFDASDLSSIVSESELKSKEIFDAVISKKTSVRRFEEESQKGSGVHLSQQPPKRSSAEPRKGVNAALKSMLTDKNCHGGFYSEIDALREANFKLQQENKNLKLQLERVMQQSHLESRFQSRDSHLPEGESRALTVHGSSFDSFEKLEESNRLLRNKLTLSKYNDQDRKEIERPSTNHSSECCRGGVFTVSSIYSKAFMKNRMPELDSFAVALKNYFQEFEDTFLKINIMFQNLEDPPQTS